MRIGVTANVGGDPERGSGIQSFASSPCYLTSSLAVWVMQNSLVPHVPKRAIAGRGSPNMLKHNMITKTAIENIHESRKILVDNMIRQKHKC